MGFDRLPAFILALPIVVAFVGLAIGLGGQATGLIRSAGPVFVGGLGIAGLILIAGALYGLRFTLRLQRYFARADATITGTRRVFANANYRPRVRFSHQGKDYDTALRTTRQLPPKQGATIRILYHPRNPRIAYEDSAFQLHQVSVALAVMGTTFILLAIVRLQG